MILLLTNDSLLQDMNTKIYVSIIIVIKPLILTQVNLLLKAPASYVTFVLYSKLFFQILGRFSKTQETNLRDKKKAFVLNIHHHCLLTFS